MVGTVDPTAGNDRLAVPDLGRTGRKEGLSGKPVLIGKREKALRLAAAGHTCLSCRYSSILFLNHWGVA